MSDPLEDHLRRQLDRSHRFFWHRVRWRVVSGYLPKEEPFQLVDVGAGAGLLAGYLARDRPLASYRFVEPLPSLRSFLRERHGPAADAGDDSDYHRARYVTLLDVLEHQADDRQFMADLVARMETGAGLLLTVPAGEHLWSQWDVSLGHVRRYDPQSLLECLDGLPLEVHEVSYLFPELVPLAILRARRLHPARPPASDPAVPVDDTAAFPELPGPVNDVLTALGQGSARLRRHWRSGTSLFLAATVAPGPIDGLS